MKKMLTCDTWVEQLAPLPSVTTRRIKKLSLDVLLGFLEASNSIQKRKNRVLRLVYKQTLEEIEISGHGGS